MCDVYYEKCAYEGCNVRISLHLADFDTGRDEIEAYCYNHIPEDTSDGVLFEVNDEGCPEYDEPEYNGKMFLRALTINAKANWTGNDYNGDCKMIELFGRTGEKMEDLINVENAKAKVWMDQFDQARKDGRMMEFLEESREKKRRVRHET